MEFADAEMAGYKPGDSRPPLTQPLGEERTATSGNDAQTLEARQAAVAEVLREHRSNPGLTRRGRTEPERQRDQDQGGGYYETVLQVDPYSRNSALFMNIPHGDNWTRWGWCWDSTSTRARLPAGFSASRAGTTKPRA